MRADMPPVPVLIAAHICSMLGFATYAAQLPELRDAWALTNAQAGVIGGMFFAGYVLSVSHWTAATDRAAGRQVYVAGALVPSRSPIQRLDSSAQQLYPLLAFRGLP